MFTTVEPIQSKKKKVIGYMDERISDTVANLVDFRGWKIGTIMTVGSYSLKTGKLFYCYALVKGVLYNGRCAGKDFAFYGVAVKDPRGEQLKIKTALAEYQLNLG